MHNESEKSLLGCADLASLQALSFGFGISPYYFLPVPSSPALSLGCPIMANVALEVLFLEGLCMLHRL